jgi:hypothetical protein
LSLLAGRPVVPDSTGGYVLDMPQGQVRILPEAAGKAVLPGQVVPPAPCIAGLTLRTSDANTAVRAWLVEREMPHRVTGRVVLVSAGGVAVRFIG